MRRSLLQASLFVMLAACGGPEVTPAVPSSSAPPPPPASAAEAAPRTLPYPKTRVVDVADTLFGITVKDPYRWLEDKSSPEVGEWLKAQDDFARGELGKLPERDALAKRFKELFYIDAISAPRHRGKRYFYSRRHATKEKSILYYREGKDGAEKVLLDPNGWSEDGSLSLGVWDVSWDGKTVAYSIKKNAADEATMVLMDVATGKKSDKDVIEGARYASASWTPKNDGFYYTYLPMDKSIKDEDRPGHAEVRFHKVGEDPKKDKVVHERTGNPSVFIYPDLSLDGRWLFIYLQHGWARVDVYFKDLKAKGDKFTPLAVGRNAHFSVEAYKDVFYVSTDEDAPKGRIFKVDPKKPEKADWKELIAERADANVDGASIIGGKLAVGYLKDAHSELWVYGLDGKKEREVALPGVGTLGGPSGRSDEDEAYYSYTSFTTPTQIHEMSMKTGATKLYAEVKVPIDATPYTVEQVFYPSKDGTRISMFVVRRKDLKRDGSHRLMLHGYGGFQASETSIFTASIYPWLERGGIYALPNLRGGGEYGEEWHKAGMLLKKQNVFDDFIAAAEYLIKEGYTRKEKLVISGGSNGGLLVGAAMTQRPDLFAAVLCGVPLLDMVRYHLFGAGKTWIGEYGSADDQEQLKVLYGYSPYHHVTAGTKYPALLLLAADSDDRVDPMHARKFAAAVQAASSGGPVLLRVERNSGHGGADQIKAEVQKSADRVAFALEMTKDR